MTTEAKRLFKLVWRSVLRVSAAAGRLNVVKFLLEHAFFRDQVRIVEGILPLNSLDPAPALTTSRSACLALRG